MNHPALSAAGSSPALCTACGGFIQSQRSPCTSPHGKSIPNEQILHGLAVPRGSCSTEAGTTCPSCFPRFPMARVQQHLADVTFLMGEQGQGQPLGFCGVPSWPPLWGQSCSVPCMSRKRTSCSHSPWHGSVICSPSAALARVFPSTHHFYFFMGF